MSVTFLSNIPLQWKRNQGIGVKIGIIDAGFDVDNVLLKQHIAKYDSFGYTNKDHGTHVASIIAIKDLMGEIGLANKSHLYLVSIPVGEKNGVTYLCKALQKMLQYNVDVLNMSFSVYSDNSNVKQMLYQFYKRKTILVAAFSEQLLYPHSYRYVLSAGKQLITKNSFYTFIDDTKLKYLKGTSMQAAYISSVAALAKSYDKNITKDFFINKIIESQQMNFYSNLSCNQFSLKLK